MYAYPGHVSPELIEVMATQPKIVPYLDMPLQYPIWTCLYNMPILPSYGVCVDRIAWRWSTSISTNYALLCRTLLCARLLLWVILLGETEAEFDELLTFIDAVQFDKVDAFTFSPEPGIPAALLPDPIPDAVQEERYNRLMETQQAIILRRNQIQVGKKLEILIEGDGELHQEDHEERQDTTLNDDVLLKPEPLLLGRSYRDTPEVDSLVLIPGISGIPAGEMIEVVINGAMEYDLACG